MVDYEGGTYVSQFQTDDILHAIAEYNREDPSGQGAVPLECDPVNLDGLRNVWCTTALSRDDCLIIANIVMTETQ